MIRSSLVRCGPGSPDFATRVAHLDEMNRMASKLARQFKSGRFARASGEERDATSTVSFRGWRKLMTAYRKSDLRKVALERFSGNTWRYSGLKVRTDKDAQILLALETYFQSAGMFMLLIYSSTVPFISVPCMLHGTFCHMNHSIMQSGTEGAGSPHILRDFFVQHPVRIQS